MPPRGRCGQDHMVLDVRGRMALALRHTFPAYTFLRFRASTHHARDGGIFLPFPSALLPGGSLS